MIRRRGTTGPTSSRSAGSLAPAFRGRLAPLPMPPIVIDIRNAEDARDVVHRAVQALAEGQLVALPTETVYGLAASACRADAVERLLRAKGRPTAQPLALAIKSAEEATDFVPDMSPLARRLARRCWPGPVTLVVDNQHKDGLTQQLPERGAASRHAQRHDRPARAGQRNVARRAADAHRARSCSPAPIAAASPMPSPPRKSCEALGERRGAGARRRSMPLRAAVVGRARQEQSLRDACAKASSAKRRSSGWPASWCCSSAPATRAAARWPSC